jgi:hypothetical protein
LEQLTQGVLGVLCGRSSTKPLDVVVEGLYDEELTVGLGEGVEQEDLGVIPNINGVGLLVLGQGHLHLQSTSLKQEVGSVLENFE